MFFRVYIVNLTFLFEFKIHCSNATNATLTIHLIQHYSSKFYEGFRKGAMQLRIIFFPMVIKICNH